MAYPVPIEKRFWPLVKKAGADECWSYGSSQAPGYRKVSVEGRMRVAHRVSYELTYGPIPAGLLVCHRCDNPGCVNPAHLFLGTHADNMRDCVRKGRNRKPEPRQGHPTGEVLTVHEAAKSLGVTPERILQLIRAGRLPAVKIAGVWLLEPGAVARFQPRPIGYPRGRPRK